MKSRTVAVWGAVLLSTSVAVGYELTSGRDDVRSLAVAAVSYVAVFAITSFFAVWTATELHLPSLLMLSALNMRQRGIRLAIYGILLGVGISLASGLLYFATAGDARGPWYFERVQNPFGMVMLSARAAFLEETFFRLFAIPFLVSVAMRLRFGWRPRFPGHRSGSASSDPCSRTKPSKPMIAGAVTVSAALFAIAHPFNPWPAFGFGILLGISYLKGGWESAVAAHFVANLLVFAALYS